MPTPSGKETRRSVESVGQLLLAECEMVHIQAEDFPFVLVWEVGVLDQLAPARLDFAQPLQEDFETVLSLQKQSAFALDHVRAGQACQLVLDAGAQVRIDGVGVYALHAASL